MYLICSTPNIKGYVHNVQIAFEVLVNKNRPSLICKGSDNNIFYYIYTQYKHCLVIF